ncbi:MULTISPECIES: DUF2269 domain-containing protein [Corynebacterium]|uniref:DUF2269 domain-containing protein n=1 Tax=Corynebacterium TaxID=1716 RepID=UPI00124E431A|nr:MULTISPECIES: DUF2269 domain-containing protein [Corynebacterium]
MSTVMLALHVLSAVLFLGPVTVAVSTFHVQAAHAHNGNDKAKGSAALLYRISNTYGLLSLLVPLLGFGVMFSNLDAWIKEGLLHTSILLSVIAWAVLYFLILPRQKAMAAELGILDADDMPENATVQDWDKAKSQLSMFGGIFSLLWIIIFALMMTM